MKMPVSLILLGVLGASGALNLPGKSAARPDLTLLARRSTGTGGGNNTQPWEIGPPPDLPLLPSNDSLYIPSDVDLFILAISVVRGSCMLSLPFAGALRSGVKYIPANLLPSHFILLEGSAAVLNRALTYVRVDSAPDVQDSSTCELRIRQNNSMSHSLYGMNIGSQTSSQQPMAFTPRRLALTADASSGSGVTLLTNLTLLYPNAAANRSLNLIVSAATGDLCLLNSQLRIVPWSRVFRLTVQSAGASPSVFALSTTVPWRYEQQRIDFFALSLNSGAGAFTLSFGAYSVNTTDVYLEVGIDGDLARLASDMSTLLATLDNVGAVEVLPVYSHSDPAYFGGVVVTFTTNAGALPLVQMGSSDGRFRTEVTRLSVGSLQPEVVDISVSSSDGALTPVTAGQFVLAFPRGTQSASVVQTLPLPFNCSIDDLRAALAAVRDYSGWVDVSDASSNGTFFSWRLSFLTTVGRPSGVAVLKAGGSTAASDPRFCDVCEPFSGPVDMTATLVFPGTVPMGGTLRMALSVGGKATLTAPFSFQATSEALSAALLAVEGVPAARVSQRSCSTEGTCRWLVSIGSTDTITEIRSVATGLRGSDVQATVTRAESGSSATTGVFQLAFSQPGEPDAASPWIDLTADASVIEQTLQATAGSTVGVLVSKSVYFSGTTMTSTAFTVKLQASALAMSQGTTLTSTGEQVVFRDAALLPLLKLRSTDLRGSQAAVLLQEVPSNETIQSARYALRVSLPLLEVRSEVQTIVCAAATNVTGASAGLASLSYMGFASPPFSVADTSLLSGDALAALLQQLPSSPGQVRLSTNSTTGALCPVDGVSVFATNITFGDYLGDAPMLVFLNVSLSSALSLSVLELVRGSSASVREVQLLTFDISTLGPAASAQEAIYIGVQGTEFIRIALLASETDVAGTIDALVGAQGTSVRIAISPGTAVSWTVSFPDALGAVELLKVATSCVPSTTYADATITGMARWQGTVCVSETISIAVNVSRLVSGFAPLYGAVVLSIGSSLATVPLSRLGTSLEPELRRMSGQDVRVTSTRLNSSDAVYVIELPTAQPLGVDISAVALTQPACALSLHPSASAMACFFPFEWRGVLFSRCAHMFDSRPACSTTYNLTADGSWGECVACPSSPQPYYDVSLSPLLSIIQLQAPAASTSSALASVLYVPPRKQQSSSRDAVSVVATDPVTGEAVAAEADVELAPPTGTVDLHTPAFLIALEDSPLFIDSLVLSAAEQTRVVVSLAVGHGQLTTLNPAGVKFAPTASLGNLTMVGNFTAVRRAVAGLVYRAQPEWSSSCPTPASQTLSVSTPVSQRYLLHLAVNSSADPSSAPVLTIELDCLLPYNGTTPALSYNVSLSGLAAELQSAVTAMGLQCDALHSRFFALNGTTTQTPAPRVSVAAMSGAVLNGVPTSWMIDVAAPLLGGAFPELRVSALSATAGTLVKSELWFPADLSFRLGYGGAWTGAVPVGSTRVELQSALLSLDVVNSIAVGEASVTQASGRLTYTYPISLDLSALWTSDAMDISLFSSQTSVLAFGEVSALSVDAGQAPGVDVSVSVVSGGECSGDSLRVAVYDLAAATESPKEFVVPLYVVPLRDPVTVVLDGVSTVVVSEDHVTTVRGVRLVDVDNESALGNITVRVLSPNAHIEFPRVGGGVVAVDHQSYSVSLTGTVGGVSDVLGEFLYVPEADFNGRTSLTFVLASSVPPVSAHLPVDVVAVIDPITIASSLSELAVAANDSVSLDCLSLSYPDDLNGMARVVVSVSALSGAFYVPTMQFAGRDLFVPAEWRASEEVFVTGTTSEVNMMMRSLRYWANGTDTSIDTVLVQVRRQDSSELDASMSVSVRVLENSGGVIEIQVPAAPVVMSEDGTLLLAGLIAIPKAYKGMRLSAVVSCDKGSLGVSQVLRPVIQINGSVEAIRIELASTVFIPPLDYHGSVKVSISVVGITSAGSATFSSAELYVLVESVYDPPAIELHSVFATAPGLRAGGVFSLAVVEDEILIVQLEVTAPCSVAIADQQYITSLGNRVAFRDLRVNAADSTEPYVGFATESGLANSILNAIQILPVSSGYVTLKLSVTSITSESQLRAERNVTVFLKAPTSIALACKSSVRMYEGANVSLASACNVSASYSPSEAFGLVAVRLSATSGVVSVSTFGDAVRWNVAMHNGSLVIETRLLFVKDLLSSLVYTPEPLYNGKVAIDLEMSMSASTEPPSRAVIYCTVVAVNDLPVISIAGGASTRQLSSNATLPLDFVTVFDADLHEAQYAWMDVVFRTRRGRLELGSVDQASMQVLIRAATPQVVHLMGTDAGISSLLTRGLLAYLPKQLDVADYADYIDIEACDNGFTGVALASGNCSSLTVSLSVTHVTLAPSLVPFSLLGGKEDHELSFGDAVGVSFGTYSPQSTVSMLVSTTDGLLRSESLLAPASSVSFSTSLAQLLLDIKSLAFVPAPNRNMEMSIRLSLRGADFRDDLDVLVFTAPVPDAPVVFSPTQSVSIQASLSVSLATLQLAISDPDDFDGLPVVPKHLNLSTDCGALLVDYNALDTRIADPAFRVGVGARHGGGLLGFTSLALSGTAADLTSAVRAVSLQAAERRANCTLNVAITKTTSALSFEATTSVAVSVFIPAKLSLRLDEGLALTEGERLAASRLVLSIGDALPSGAAYTLTISVTAATMPDVYRPQLVVPSADSGTASVDLSSDGASVTIVGLGIRSLLTALDTLELVPPAYYHGKVFIEATLTSSDLTVQTSAEAAYYPVNSPPAIQVLTTSVDTASSLASVFAVSDPDVDFLAATRAPIYSERPEHCCFVAVNVTCYGCVLLGSYPTDSVALVGTPADISDMLSEVRVVAGEGGDVAEVSITLSDLQSYGRGAPHVVSTTVLLSISPAKVVPGIQMPATWTANFSQPATIGSLSRYPTILVSMPDEHLTLTVASLGGGVLTNEVAHGQGSISNSTLSRSGSTLELEQFLYNVLYAPPRKPQDTVVFGVSFEGEVIAEVNVEVRVLGLAYPLALPLSAHNLTVPQNTPVEFDTFMQDSEGVAQQPSDFEPVRLVGTAGVFLGGSLEVQEVSTSAMYVDAVQVVTLTAPLNDSIAAGNFSLSIDLSSYGAETQISSPIAFDAAPSKWTYATGGFLGDVRDPSDSLQSKILQLLQPVLVLGIEVEVSKEVTAASTVFRLTFVKAPFTLPTMTIASNRLASAKGLPCGCEVTVGEPGNRLGGTFTLQLGGESSLPLPFDASYEQVASAVEGLSMVRAVSVSRAGPTLVQGFTWQITFFALTNAASNVAQLTAISELTGSRSINLPNTTTTEVVAPSVSVSTVYNGAGRARVFEVLTTALPVEAVYAVTVSFALGPQRMSAEFYLRVTLGNSSFVVGPVFAATVASTSEEVPGPYPPHAQLEGTKIGQSMQSLMHQLPFLSSLASGVSVAKSAGADHSTWTITFADSAFAQMTIEPSLVEAPLAVAVQLLQASNRVEGTTFFLSYGGHRTGLLRHDSSASEVEAALMSLATVHDPTTNIGRVQVGRRGPNFLGAYRWYVALTQEPAAAASSVLVSAVETAVGIETNVVTRLLRDSSAAAHGVFLRRDGGSTQAVSNLGLSSLFSPEPLVTFSAASLINLVSVFRQLAYTPPPHWDGNVALLLEVASSGSGASSHLVELKFAYAEDPPSFVWHTESGSSFTTTAVEDVASPLYRLQLSSDSSGGEAMNVSLSVLRGSLRVDMHAWSRQVSLTGNLAVLNQVLGSLQYLSCPNCNGVDHIDMLVSSSNLLSSAAATVLVRLSPVNDAPVISLANTSAYSLLFDDALSWQVGVSNISVNEMLPIASILSIEDADMVASNIFYNDIGADIGSVQLAELAFSQNLMTLSLSVAHGVVLATAISPTSLCIEGDVRRGSRRVVLKGSLADLQASIRALVYSPDLDWFGIDVLDVELDDGGNIGTGGPKSNARKVLIKMSPTAFEPSIVSPQESYLATLEDTTAVMGKLSSTDTSMPELRMSATSFQIRDRNVPVVAEGERIVVAVDTLDQAMYGSLLATATFSNSSKLSWGAFAYAGSTGTSGGQASPRFKVSLQVFHGTLTLPFVPNSMDFQFIRGSGFLDDTTIFSASLLDANAALERVLYTPDLNWNSAVGSEHGGESIKVTVTDETGLSATVSLPIQVTAVNDYPVLTLGALTVQDALLSSGDQVSRARTSTATLQCLKNVPCALLDLQLRDVDMADSPGAAATLTFMSSNGSFLANPSENGILPALHGILFSINETSASLTIPWQYIQAAIKGVYYVSGVDFTGSDEITVSASDRGNSGRCPYSQGSCALSDAVSFRVTVQDVDLPPFIVAPLTPFETTEGTALRIRGLVVGSHRHEALQGGQADSLAFLQGIESNRLYSVRLVASKGLMTLSSSVSSLRYTQGGWQDSAVMDFAAPLKILSVALSELVYFPSPLDPNEPSNVCSIVVSLRDTVSGLSAEETALFITVLPRYPKPQVHVFGEVFSDLNVTVPDVPYLDHIVPLDIREDEPMPLAAVFVSSPRTGPGSVFVLRLSATHGSFVSDDLQTRALLRLQPAAGVQLFGSLAQLNGLLAAVSYLPDTNFNGADYLVVEICDASPGVPAALCSTARVQVIVAPVNDPPLWTVLVPAAQFLQDRAVSLGSLVAVDDVDSSFILVSMHVDVGGISLQSAPVDFSLLNGTGENDQYVMFSASVPSAKLLVQTAVYFPPPGWNSADLGKAVRLDVYAEDMEAIRLPASASYSFLISKGVPRLPLFTLPGASYRTAPCDSVGVPYIDEDYPAAMLCSAILSVTDFEVIQGIPTAVTGVGLRHDIDLSSLPDILTLSIRAGKGSVRLPAAESLGLRVDSSDASGGVRVSGAVGALTKLLASLQYLSPEAYSKSDEILLGVKSAALVNAAWSNATLPVAVVRGTFAAAVVADSYAFEVLEDHVVALSGVRVAFTDTVNANALDSDFVERQSTSIRVAVSVANGYVLLSLRGLNVTFFQQNTSNEETEVFASSYLKYQSAAQSSYLWLPQFDIQGSVSHVNLALSSLLYRPALNWNSESGIGIDLDVVSLTAAFADSPADTSPTVLSVMVHAANDAPAISSTYDMLSGSVWTEDLLSHSVVDTEVLFVAMNAGLSLSQVAVRDVDLSPDEAVLVSIVAENGVVAVVNTLAAAAASLSRPLPSLGLTFISGTGTNDTSMQFRAPISIANEALSTLLFYPTKDFYGYGARLTVTVDDLGGAGSGGSKSDSRVWRIVVDQRNLPPEIVVPSSTGGASLFAVDEGAFSQITGALNNVSVTVTGRDTGFELFAFYEPSVYSSDLWGAAQFEAGAEKTFDIYPGSSSSHPSFFLVFGDDVYFQADDGVHGAELWRQAKYSEEPKQQRTLAPALFADLLPGKGSSSPSYLAVHSGHLYFSSSGLDTSWMVVYAHRDTCGSFRQSTFDSRVHFAVSGSNTWEPSRLYDCPTGYRWVSTDEAQALFPSAVDIGGPQQLTYFDQCGWNGFIWGGMRRQMFRFSDSAVTGASKSSAHSDAYRPDLSDYSTVDFAGIVCVVNGYLGISAPQTNSEVWRTDGTVEGTRRTDDVYPGPLGSQPAYLTAFAGDLYFAATTNVDGRELWRTAGDGVTQATIVSFGTTTGIYPQSGSADPSDLTSTPQHLFFAATEPTRGRELWTVQSSDGTLSVVDIMPGAASSSPRGFSSCGGQLVVFAATTAAGEELWASSDGSAANTYLVRDICPGSGSSSPQYITCVAGLFYFQADDCTHGAELWASDGLRNGVTVLVRDVRPGSAGSSPSFLTAFTSQLDHKQYLIFTATDGLYTSGVGSVEGYGGSQIWRSDGSSAGTSRAIMQTENDLYIDRTQMNSAWPEALIAFDGALLIAGSRDRHIIVPSGLSGSTSGGSPPQFLRLSQAVVVSDLDTPLADFLDLNISAAKGVVLLAAPNASNPTTVLSFLVADPAPEQSLLLLNVLENRGHNVTVVATGQATLDATGVTVGSTANGSFDSILVSCALDAATLDILQTLRLLRSGNVKLPIVAYCTDSSVARSALEAGANNFLVEPNLSGSGDRATFEAFASSVLELLNLPAGNLVVNSITPAPAGTNLSFTGAIFGSAISLSGTALSLNSILRSIFYFAPQGVTGEDSVTFTVQDYPHPEACQLVVVAEPAYAALSGVPGPPVCDASTRNVVSASLRVIVIAVNHAPAISTAAPTFTAVIDESTAVPTLVVTDSDFSSSTTATATPVMSVLVTVSYGVVSFPTLQGLSLSAGQGFADRVAALNGPLLRINAALAAMQYTCRAADFCSSAGADSVSVRADDNGFTGTGGALTATATVTVNVVAA